MINLIINFLKSLFIKDKEEPTMEALHNISIPKDTKFRVVDDAGVDIETGKYVGDYGIIEEKEEMSKFDEIIEVVLEHEGGYVNDPKDPGGETNFGIAKRSHPDVDIKNLTKEGAKEIYKEVYWDKNKVESLPEELWHIYFDMCVNQGKSRAVKIIQRAVNGKGGSLTVDGGMGPMTIAAIGKSRVELDRIRAYRVKYYADLATKKPDLERFYFGWFKRALEV
jgi:lysozyme family protein